MPTFPQTNDAFFEWVNSRSPLVGAGVRAYAPWHGMNRTRIPTWHFRRGSNELRIEEEGSREENDYRTR